MAAERQYVVFKLDQQEYGAPIEAVREVGVYQAPTRLPGTPAYVEGVINLRGQVIPVVDLRRRLGLSTREVDDGTRIMVLEAGSPVGLVVDEVHEVTRIADDAVEPPEQMAGGISPAYLRGVAKVDDRLILLLAVEQLVDVGAGQVG